MPALHIRDVPNEILGVLKVRAAQSGRSLQNHVRQLLIEEASTLSPSELAAEARSIASRGRVTEDDILAELDAIRRSRSA
ncbi:MAG: hypothetical protein ABJA74_05220 [Lapillicoccus sp.]